MSYNQSNYWSRFWAILMYLPRIIMRFWHWYKRQYTGAAWWKKIILGITTFIFLIVCYIFAVLFNLFWLFGPSPSQDEIMHPRNAAASEIYSADGKLLGKFFNQNRSPVPYDSISPVFFKALISTEDERFYQHHGIDFTGMLAAVKDAVTGKPRGASTITQQLVKNMFRVRTKYSTGLLGKIPGLGILIMKSKEMIIASEIEFHNTKKDILKMYANTVDFGSNAYGIKAAAKTYFDTTPSKLKTEEAAVLVGMLKATSSFNPRINPKRSLIRRNVVLENMYIHGCLSRHDCDSLKKIPILLHFNIETAYDGVALYFRQAVADYIKENCPDVDPYTDGLKIYTTLDSRMQKYAEEAVNEQMKNVQHTFNNHWEGMGEPWRDEKGNIIPGFIQDIARRTDSYKTLDARFHSNMDSINFYLNKPHKVKLFSYNGPIEKELSTLDSIRYMVRFMHAGFVAMEPKSGYVKAWVGDIDFKSWKYDKVKAMRQPGSTFKLFVYSEAMEKGLTPADTRKDQYIQMEVYDKFKHKNVLWCPHNAEGRFSNAEIPLKAAFARSINTIAVELGQELGISNIINLAHKMGIKSPLDDTPALALGASDVNLLEMVNSYATIANGGVHVDPVLVTKIVDSKGEIIYQDHAESIRAVSPKTSFYMQKMFEAGMTDSGGTSQALQSYLKSYFWNKHISCGGKTGTSNNHSDAWFIGVTPNLVGGAWVGGEYRCIHFRTGALGQGSKTALPIFGLFIQKVLSDPTLRNKYLKVYPPINENIDPATYGGNFIMPSENKDTTLVKNDSILNSENLMDKNENKLKAENSELDETKNQKKKKNPSEQDNNKDNLFN